MPATPIIESKLVPPPAPERMVPRPRLARLLGSLLELRRTVWVSATAGAGKTTAVVEALAELDLPLAWLTLDDTDTAPGRLLVYLEAAIARVLPELDGIATQSLAAQVPHREAAGILADAVRRPAILVVDEVDRLDGGRAALAVLAGLVRHARRGLRIVLIGRREVALDLGADPAGAAAITENELAFTVDEAAAALAHAGARDVDPEAAVRAVGGWVTGVLFEAWRSDEHVIGRGGEADPLHGYLATQIVEELDPDDVELIETCAVLDAVDARRAAAMGVVDAAARLRRLRGRHLPVTWSSDGQTMRFHPRLREYLIARLERRGTSAVREVRRRHGLLLASEGHHEEAVEALLQAGDLELARASMELAIRIVVERLDFAVAERWLQEVGGRGSSPELSFAEMMLALGQEQYLRGAALADELGDEGIHLSLIRTHPAAACMLAWCLFHVGRISDVEALYELVRGTAEGELIHELLTLAVLDGSGVLVARRGDPLDGLLLRLHWSHGRLRELRDAPVSRWAAAVGDPWRIAGLRATGRLVEALGQLEALSRSGAVTGLHELIGAEVFIDLGRASEAWASLARGRAKVQMSGSVFLLFLSLLIEVRLEIRLRHDRDRASAALDTLERHPQGRSYRWVTEQAATLRGLIRLHEGDDARALVALRSAVASMVAGERMLELPAAATYLSEAEWRGGEEDAADRAADLALWAAERQGADHLLMQALTDFPQVLARRMDAESNPRSRWHALARSLVTSGALPALPIGARIHLCDLGSPQVRVDGESRALRLTKSVELIALITCSDAALERRFLLNTLFDGRADDSARSYLRQALREIRTAIPELLREEESLIEIRRDAVVVTDSGWFEAMLAEAYGLGPPERYDLLRQALVLFARGEYMSTASSPWVEERREALRAKANRARSDAAELAYQLGRYAEADQLLRSVLTDDPLREEAWRLRVRLSHTLADDDAVIETYRQCRAALATIGLEPSASMRRLVRELRA